MASNPRQSLTVLSWDCGWGAAEPEIVFCDSPTVGRCSHVLILANRVKAETTCIIAGQNF